jgi:hypothetical protein
MKLARKFVPIAERDLIFTNSDGYESAIHVAISAPYKPAQDDAMKEHAGCLVLTCEEEELAAEVFGIDEMEALNAGLEFLRTFLSQLVKQGTVTYADGSAFHPDGSPLLRGLARGRA